MEYILNTNELRSCASELRAGDRVVLSGTVYTSRDAAHKRIAESKARSCRMIYRMRLFIMQVLLRHRRVLLLVPAVPQHQAEWMFLHPIFLIKVLWQWLVREKEALLSVML